jgi:hypothetical protein
MMAKVKWIFLLFFLSLLVSCVTGGEESTPAIEPVVQPAETEAPVQAETVEEEALLSHAEQLKLKEQYAALAAVEITSENAEKVAEDLEREIDAELASGQ